MSVGGAFMPKVIQTQFYLPPGKAALLFGVIAIPCAFSGNLLGEKKRDSNMLCAKRNFFANSLRCHWLLSNFVVCIEINELIMFTGRSSENPKEKIRRLLSRK